MGTCGLDVGPFLRRKNAGCPRRNLTSNVIVTSVNWQLRMFTKIIVASTLAGLVSLFIADYHFYLNYVNLILAANNEGKGTRLFYQEELKEYNGVVRPELYLVILGKVYNVTSGKNHYGPNQAYHVFVGNLRRYLK